MIMEIWVVFPGSLCVGKIKFINNSYYKYARLLKDINAVVLPTQQTNGFM